MRAQFACAVLLPALLAAAPADETWLTGMARTHGLELTECLVPAVFAEISVRVFYGDGQVLRIEILDYHERSSANCMVDHIWKWEVPPDVAGREIKRFKVML